MSLMTFCEKCGSPMVMFMSTNRKKCSNGRCMREIEWNLKEGQKSVLIEGLAGGKEEPLCSRIEETDGENKN